MKYKQNTIEYKEKIPGGANRLWNPPIVLYSGYRVYFPGIKRPGRGVNHPPPTRAKLKEKVEPYL